MNWNEAGDWVFSAAYHDWQDRQARANYRHGSPQELRAEGWGYGLFTIKSDIMYLSTDGARWPAPEPNHDLDKLEMTAHAH